jgi:hypothetical protein
MDENKERKDSEVTKEDEDENDKLSADEETGVSFTHSHPPPTIVFVVRATRCVKLAVAQVMKSYSDNGETKT